MCVNNHEIYLYLLLLMLPLHNAIFDQRFLDTETMLAIKQLLLLPLMGSGHVL